MWINILKWIKSTLYVYYQHWMNLLIFSDIAFLKITILKWTHNQIKNITVYSGGSCNIIKPRKEK